MIKSKVRTIREKLGYTQSKLAEQANLSIRTIQRIESGQTIPKGYTLNALAEVLKVDKIELLQQPLIEPLSSEDNLKLRMINLSALCFLGIPFGNILIPFMIWNKNKAQLKVDEVGRRIINFQIIWTLCTAILLIISPFLQTSIPWDFTLILMVGLLAVCINLFFIIKTAFSLMRQEYDVLPLKLRFL